MDTTEAPNMETLLDERADLKAKLDAKDGEIRAEAERIKTARKERDAKERAALAAADAVLVRHRAPKAEATAGNADEAPAKPKRAKKNAA